MTLKELEQLAGKFEQLLAVLEVTEEECTSCEGTGEGFINNCDRCKGAGVVLK